MYFSVKIDGKFVIRLYILVIFDDEVGFFELVIKVNKINWDYYFDIVIGWVNGGCIECFWYLGFFVFSSRFLDWILFYCMWDLVMNF